MTEIARKQKVLILCTGNSCRSQMAEGFLRHLASDAFEVTSAGTSPSEKVHPLAIQVMAEVGVDISHHRPKDVKDFLGRIFIHYLIIVCDDSQQQCPKIFPGMRQRLLWPFEDPAEFAGSPEKIVSGFRRVRDQIGDKIREWIVASRIEHELR